MTSLTNNNQDTRPITYASAIIGGDQMTHNYWNKYFGFIPNIVVEKGKHFITPAGKQSSSLGRTNIWGYSTKNIIFNSLITPHLEHLILKLCLPRPDIKSFIEANDLRFYVSCYWWNPEGDRIPVIDPQLDAMIRQSGGNIFIDEYPCDIHIAEEF